MKEPEYAQLCHRCEHRARVLEGDFAPRYECGDVGKAVCGCYMYRPTRPVAMVRNKGDKRPAFGPHMISARMTGVVLPEDALKMYLDRVGKALVCLWRVKKADKRPAKASKGVKGTPPTPKRSKAR